MADTCTFFIINVREILLYLKPVYYEYMGRPVDIKSGLKPFKKIGKMWDEDVWPVESLKMMNRPDPTQPDPTRPDPAWPDPTVTLFDGLFLRKYER